MGLIDSRVVSDHSSGKSVFDSLNDHASQLAESAKKTSGYISLKSYCVGDGVTDDTTGFLNALTYAKANKLGIFVDGTFLIKQSIVIENDTIPEIFGVSKNKSVLLFDISSGFAIDNKSYFSKALSIRNLKIQLKDTTKTASGLRINFGSWGGSAKLENVDITDFTDVVLNTVEAFNCKFEVCRFVGGQQGGVYTAKLLKIEKGATFSNVNNFNKCGFEYGKIAIQNLGGVNYSFRSCQFEHLSLFLHSPNIGLSLRNNFEYCWFEEITKGILNADIDESTLTPILPVQNKGAIIDFTRFENNYVSTNATTNQLNADIEPDWYQSFVYETGVKVNVKKSKPWLNATMQNGWTGTVQYFKNDLGQVTLKISGLTKGTTTALTVIANLPTGYQPVAHFPIVLEDSPNGGVGKMLYLATNGNLIIPSGQDFSQPFTYSGLVTFYAG